MLMLELSGFPCTSFSLPTHMNYVQNICVDWHWTKYFFDRKFSLLTWFSNWKASVNNPFHNVVLTKRSHLGSEHMALEYCFTDMCALSIDYVRFAMWDHQHDTHQVSWHNYDVVYKYNMVWGGVVKTTVPEVLADWDYLPTRSGGR